MKVLALETSTRHGGAALVAGGAGGDPSSVAVIAEETTDRQRAQSELLHVFAGNVLKKAGLTLADVDAFAVGRGPGSFTGIRVAANAGKTFAAALGKPLIAVDTLTLVAARVRDRSRPVLVAVNAYKNMVYAGLFDVRGEEPEFLNGPAAVEIPALADWTSGTPGPLTLAGDGFELLSDLVSAQPGRFVRESEPLDFPSPGTLGLLAHRRLEKGLVLDWKAFTPLYLRASEAEESARRTLTAKDPLHGKDR